ncbi:alkaline phosphatase family protein [Sphingomonas glacialis]|uniref:Alkaline phosphatase n=1 Tax=Sphingomonas glacialis TaxID=658225 RepID=A0A502FZ06_9SPHN|nr:alkaline phosphatase family protein [Sphingomonas glacialis]TPG54719.1 alkaline phosphatase family protein [Sphingomonas glacialis]
MKRQASLLAMALALLSAPLSAQQAAPFTPPASAPKLIVVISVDQFSADLFAEYRKSFTGGFARLQQGGVFPSGYQSHAATETCPGHSTILTGFRPEHTGIIANNWTDLSVARADKVVYCAEDETVPGTTHDGQYTVSDKHLLVPTLGERMKAANPAIRVVSVAGKDRAAVMMGGHNVDELWWWNGKAFVSYAGRATPAVVTRANAATAARIAAPQAALDVPEVCTSHDRAVQLGGGKTVGAGHFERAAGSATGFRASPAFDGAIVALAAGLVQDMKLGQGPTTDIIDVGASATDYIGHTYGTEGAEMCIQLQQLDATLGSFFQVLDSTGVDYEVVLTADHGGNDLPEREVDAGLPDAQRAKVMLAPAFAGKEIAAKLGIAKPVLFGDIPNGDVYIAKDLTSAQHKAVETAAIAYYKAAPQVAEVFTAAQIRATPSPKGPPEKWTMLERARASFLTGRSGDFVVLLKPRVTPIPSATGGYVATHGSPYDYDRRVPILFWRKGMTGFEHTAGVETVDIAPTLARQIALPLTAPKMDGRCLDLAAGGAPCR